jgi:hypothetical protein
MSKEFASVGVNTDPMSVQLYFDENNSIKWKIIFSNTSNIISESYNKNQINEQTNKEDMSHLITTLFPYIYIIGSKNVYPFLFNNINLSINDTDFIVTDMEINYNNFDYYKYNQIIQENLTKNVSWKHYLKMLKNKENINIKLNPIELSQINALINILGSAISFNYNKILIIFNDFNINTKNLIWLEKNINSYEINNSEILLLKFIDYNNTDQKISAIGKIKEIDSFLIKKSFYNTFLNKLLNKNISWQSCLLQIIEENYFKCNQVNVPIFN